MLTLLLLIPLIGSSIILPMPNTLESKERMKKIAIVTSLINFFISLFIWYQFDSNTTLQIFRKNLILVLIERFSVVLRHANRYFRKISIK